MAVGSEMLTPFRVDTNSLFITERLNTIGFDVRIKTVVGDDIGELAALVRASLTWADLIVLTGGLGPTADDITRDAVAQVLELPFDEDEATVARIRERFARRGMVMPEINRRQAHGAARGDAARQPERHGAGTLAGAREDGHRAAAGAASRDEADVRGGRARSPRAPERGRRPVPPRAEDHRPARVGRRCEGAADLRPVADAGGADQHDDSGGARPDRTAPDGQRPEP